MHLTIVICTHNRAPLLHRTLTFLNQAQRPPDCQVEIRVVANACRDGTRRVLQDYQARATEEHWLPLRWQEEPIPGKSRALNAVLPEVTTPVVAFVDDDHRVDPDYLLGVCRAVQRYPEASLFCGRILPDWDGTEPSWVHDRGPYRIYPLPIPRFDLGPESREVTRDIAVPGGGNLFLRTRLFAQVGYFSLDFGPVGHNLGGAEDMQWVLRAMQGGAKLRYIPEVVQYHFVDPQRLTLPYLMRKAYERSGSTVRLSSTVQERRLPLYMLRKAGEYFFASLVSFRQTRRRFYLVRLAASLGEIKSFLQGTGTGLGTPEQTDR
jgi:GT2 family glycosyltransferase